MFNKIKNEIKTEVATMNIGNNIAVLRKKKGITQEELANELGVSAQAVSKWENNSSCPDVSLLTKIADYFGVSVDALLRTQEDDIVDLAEEKEDNVKPDDKKNIVIKIMLPFKFVKLGLNIGTMFGLDKDISSKIVTLAESNVTDIVNIDTENGEHIEIMLD